MSNYLPPRLQGVESLPTPTPASPKKMLWQPLFPNSRLLAVDRYQSAVLVAVWPEEYDGQPGEGIVMYKVFDGLVEVMGIIPK